MYRPFSSVSVELDSTVLTDCQTMADSRQSYPTWAKYGILPTVSTGDRRKSKPSWEIARDISMDLLSRRATKLSIKQGKLIERFLDLI